MWVEFVVGSHPYSKSFSSGHPVFLAPQNSSFEFFRHLNVIMRRAPVCGRKNRCIGQVGAKLNVLEKSVV